ncbi:MAG: hypothetical protein Q9164_000853 [Protoblastenia rupestris]
MQRKTGRRLLDVAAATSRAKSIAKSHMPKTPIEDKTISEDTRPSLPELPSSHKTSQSETKFENQSDHSNKFEKKVDSTHAALKREQSDISKSFPKTRPNFQKENTNSSAGSAVINNNDEKPNVQEDASLKAVELMKEATDDKQEGIFFSNTEDKAPSRQSTGERAEQLRRMMEDGDDDRKGTAVESPEALQDTESFKSIPTPQVETSPVLADEIQRGRRRGRRKVMKKKTIKDDEGYLVTKEEPAWESFSEDDSATAKEKILFSSALSTGKSKKGGGGRPGQGNIMSFFGKK